jgi:AcrR family transcriptional regulator
MTAAVAEKAETLLLDVRTDSRERLLQVAIRLFARDGLGNVSLKAISDAAGNRNKSAVGYHFSGKQGLVDAVLERLHADLAPGLDAQLSRFEQALDSKAPLSVDEVVLGLLTPVMQLYVQAPHGQNAIKVLARLMHEPVASFPNALRKSSRALSERALAVFQRLLPEKDVVALEHHLQHAVMATVNGLALQKQFMMSQRSRWSDASMGEIFLSYASYVAAGIAGRPLHLDTVTKTKWLVGMQV